MNNSQSSASTVTAEHVRFSVKAVPNSEASTTWDVAVQAIIQPGWKLFGEGSEDGIPVSITSPDATVTSVTMPKGTLTGSSRFEAHLDAESDFTVQINYQLCSGDLCERPRSANVRVERAA